jgi:DNA-binding CsgD family transcriptional regulator
VPPAQILAQPAGSVTETGPAGWAAPGGWTEGPDPLLELAGRLATAGSLTLQVDTTLPLLARLCNATVAVFAVAGTRAAGVRCWPPDLAWAEAMRDAFAASWEVGPLTLWCRQVGVVPPVPVGTLFEGWGTEPGMVLMHSGRVLHELLVIPVARTGATIAAYFAARYERPFDPVEVAAARAAQTVAVASHGRFLRPPEPALTARQQEVLRLLAEGRTVRAISSRLGISQSTVDKHIRDLYRRLGTQDRASTTHAAEVRGLLDGLVGEDWQDLLIVGP